ncbi:hypothetical protein [Novosphingobium mangrovi (ex Huang et al. 2023)]|uniref:Uncharacterized protein n=1 Tax=Novosphingobium mangrovi (ex Huang et al. 2023) TaxID=2976432 RepID=A0ABT2I270_9SPHN|nr:hypothetical protein [Novosphingobium mangrovi (ex Huang et al. 2023)]MCT2398899.1 hypothetical protein [Novosphingobium mangrovi (ex Huang et al. 2023)]
MAALVEVAAGARLCRYFVTYTGVGLPFRLGGSHHVRGNASGLAA